MASTLDHIKKNFFDREKVLRAVDKGVRKQFSRFGGTVRKISRNSIRKRKAASAPGSPPTNRTDLLRKNIFYSYDEKKKQTVIGPVLLNKSAFVLELLEFGGTEQANGRIIEVKNKVGRDAKGKFVSAGTSFVKLEGTIRHQPRPFMRPAYAKALPGFLQSLKGSIK